MGRCGMPWHGVRCDVYRTMHCYYTAGPEAVVTTRRVVAALTRPARRNPALRIQGVANPLPYGIAELQALLMDDVQQPLHGERVR